MNIVQACEGQPFQSIRNAFLNCPTPSCVFTLFLCVSLLTRVRDERRVWRARKCPLGNSTTLKMSGRLIDYAAHVVNHGQLAVHILSDMKYSKLSLGTFMATWYTNSPKLSLVDNLGLCILAVHVSNHGQLL